ncbi:MAG: ABC transporter substrate-binding protein [Nitrospirota bacterium]|nr:ABC transporter substrate-binding protein [Nitrospirota bacterium]
MTTKDRSLSRSLCLSAVLILTAVLFLFLACVKDPEKQYLVGTINPNPRLVPVMGHFRQAMAEHGYIEGKNLTYIHSAGEDAVDAALRDFKEKKADLVLTFTTPSLQKAAEALSGSGVPIVAMSYDPVGGGVVKSLIYKKENITGIQTGRSVQKALEWLLLIVPGIKRIFVPVTYDTPAAQLSLTDLKEAARKMDVELLVAEVRTPEELKRSLSSMPEDIGAVFIPHSILIVTHLDEIVGACTRRRIPSAAGAGYHRQGVTITYGQDYKRTGEDLALLADKVLKGTPAFSLPFKMADYSLGISLKNAGTIGLDIPDYFASQADIAEQ